MNQRLVPGLASAPTKHAKLLAWVGDIVALTEPDRVRWCDGSQAEWAELTDALVAAGTLKRLNPEKRPNSFYAASDPRDVARVMQVIRQVAVEWLVFGQRECLPVIDAHQSHFKFARPARVNDLQ